jgi:prephenate dehydrogenase
MMVRSRATSPEPTLGIIGVGGLAGFVVEGLRRAGDGRRILLAQGCDQGGRSHPPLRLPHHGEHQVMVDGAGLVILSTPPPAVLPCIVLSGCCGGPRFL